MNEKPPQLWIVAGLNGAGKSSIGSQMIANVGGADCLNPDLLSRRISDRFLIRHSWLDAFANWIAVEWMERQVSRAITVGQDVSVETVFSTEKYFPHIKRAHDNGFTVGMVYIALANVELNLERIRSRVASKGHDVPEGKVRKRHALSIRNLGAVYPLLDVLFVFDNSDVYEPVEVARKTKGSDLRILRADLLPEVLAALCPTG